MGDGTFVPKGSEMNYVPYAMGLDPHLWPDPLTFKPDRWIPFKQPSLFTMPVFQAGPRVCLGMQMALFEVRLVAAMVLQRFTFELSDPEQLSHYQVNFVINVKEGL